MRQTIWNHAEATTLPPGLGRRGDDRAADDLPLVALYDLTGELTQNHSNGKAERPP